MREAARRHGVSPATACKWWGRWRAASAEERRTLSCLFDRSSRPRRSPRLLSASVQARICVERRRTGHGPRLIAAARLSARDRLEGAASAMAAHGRRRAARAGPPLRVALPGDLLHIDWRRLPASPSLATPSPATAARQPRSGAARLRMGARARRRPLPLAYAEVLADAKRGHGHRLSSQRALAAFAEHGIRPKRLLSDNT